MAGHDEKGDGMNFIEVNGVSLRYDVQGAGRPLVLIHEMGGTMESWELVVRPLAANRRVIRYDTRGAGFSEKIRGVLKIATMTSDLIALIDALGIKEKVALAGTAVGGAIALHTAVRHPERSAAAIVTSPATSIPEANRAAVLERVARFERDGLRVAVDATADNGYPAELRTDPAKFAGFRARWLANDPVSFASIYRMLAAMDLGPELHAIQCPVLVIGGEYDRGRPPHVVEPVAKAIPGAKFKVLPTGHYAALQTPELMVEAIEGFLEEVGA
jgi:3-oxoadipate enol-lactonase